MQKASFNPHTHEGCDLCILQRGHGIAVSIHTPTKGVTWCQLCRDWLCYVSIHTPTKGVTYSAYRIFLDPQSFNPHTHEGCDPVGNPAEPCRLVSIHTPTKGVTPAFKSITGYTGSFNPHTHEGCDLAYTSDGTSLKLFQSTHPRRV